MANIITSSYIQSALQTLLFSSDSLDKTQQRTTSGLKVETAADNAGYWSKANGMSSDGKVLSSLGDALDLGASKVDTTYEAVTAAIELVDQITVQLTTAYEAGTDREALNASITALKSNLTSVTQAATFSGDNWLYNTDATPATSKYVPASFERGISGSVTLNYVSISTSATTLIDTFNADSGLLTGTIDANSISSDGTTASRNYYLLDVGSTTSATGTQIALSDETTDAELDDMITVIGYLSQQLNSLASSLGTMSNRIDQQSTFVKALQDSLDTSVGRLVDADMEEESTKLAAYESQRDLAVQILSMANNHQQSISILFG